MPVTPLFRQSPFRTHNRGITLVELLVVLAIATILTSLALPTYSDAVSRARVKSATESIHALIQQARNEAPIRDTNLSVAINASHWCVGISDTTSCDCTLTTGANACTLNVAGQEVLHRVVGDEFEQVEVSENFVGVGTTFRPTRRDASLAGTVSISSEGQKLQIIISRAGRIRVCAPDESPMPGYPVCQ